MGCFDCSTNSSRIVLAYSFQGAKSRPNECRSRTRLGSDTAAPVMAKSSTTAARNFRDLMFQRSLYLYVGSRDCPKCHKSMVSCIYCSLNAGIVEGQLCKFGSKDPPWFFETRVNLAALFDVMSTPQDAVDCVDQRFRKKRLFQISNAACFKCLLAGDFIIDSRHKNDGQIAAR